MRKAILVLFNIFLFFQLSAQASKWFVGASGSVTRMDYFIGPEAQFKKERLQSEVSFTCGANRTFLQGRFFPRIALGLGYSVDNRPHFSFSPLLKVAYSLLNLRTTTNAFHHWEEVYGGIGCRFGDKWVVHLDLLGGWMNEQFYDSYSGDLRNDASLGYELEIGLGYAW